MPVVAVAGRCTLTREELAVAGIQQVYALLDREPDVARCMADAASLLGTTGQLIAADWCAETFQVD